MLSGRAIFVVAALTFSTTAAMSGEAVLLDFTATWCAPCRQMQPVVAQLSSRGIAVRQVDVDRESQLAAQFNVDAVPTFVWVVEGREQARRSGATNLNELLELCQAPVDAASTAQFQRGPHRTRDTFAPSRWSAEPDAPISPVSNHASGVATPKGDSALVSIDEPTPPGPSPWRPGIATATVAPSAVESPQGSSPATELLSYAVRLKVVDAAGQSYGTGTVIHADGRHALVLTCGHLFREAKESGAVTVDFFSPGVGQDLPATVVSYNLDRDLALVRVNTPGAVAAAPVAPRGYRLERGAAVVSLGCDNGADVTAQASRITAIDKYLGPPNVEIAGLPVEGRSGGGLFSADGYVIGVCNAADPQDQEGLFAALGAIHEQLDEAGLAALYRDRPAAIPAVAVAVGQSNDGVTPADPHAALTTNTPRPGNWPATVESRGPGALSPAEQSLLEELREAGEGAEVVCVIRSLADPRSRSEIVVLDRASPELLARLVAEAKAQDDRHLTTARSEGPTVARRPSRTR